MTDKQKPLKPFREFDYSLVAKKIDGLRPSDVKAKQIPFGNDKQKEGSFGSASI